LRAITILSASLLLVACGGSGTKHAAGHPEESRPETLEAAWSPTDGAVVLATRRVSCGCVLEGIGACGNYVEIEGHYVPVANAADFGLGAMAWCGQEGVTAETSGEIRDGRFHADTLVVHTAE